LYGEWALAALILANFTQVEVETWLCLVWFAEGTKGGWQEILAVAVLASKLGKSDNCGRSMVSQTVQHVD
jgi:hypothetical protein